MHSDMAVSTKEEGYTMCLNGFVENHRVVVHDSALQEKNKPEATEAKLDQDTKKAKKRFSVLGFLKLLPECRKQDRNVIGMQSRNVFLIHTVKKEA